MTRYKYLVVLVLLVIASACSEAKQDHPTQSLPDTPENRTVLAKRYLAISPPGELMHGAADIAVKSFPEQDRKIFLDVMYSKSLEETMYRFELDSMVKKFTLNELQALVTYYGSPGGKSAQEKLGSLTMEVLTPDSERSEKGHGSGEKTTANSPGPARAARSQGAKAAASPFQQTIGESVSRPSWLRRPGDLYYCSRPLVSARGRAALAASPAFGPATPKALSAYRGDWLIGKSDYLARTGT